MSIFRPMGPMEEVSTEILSAKTMWVVSETLKGLWFAQSLSEPLSQMSSVSFRASIIIVLIIVAFFASNIQGLSVMNGSYTHS